MLLLFFGGDNFNMMLSGFVWGLRSTEIAEMYWKRIFLAPKSCQFCSVRLLICNVSSVSSQDLLILPMFPIYCV